MEIKYRKPTQAYYVKRAAEWFDQILPGWHKKMNAMNFNIHSDDCVLGQLGNRDAWKFAEENGIDRTEVNVMLMNHIIDLDEVNRLWRGQIKKRKDKAKK